MVFALAGDSTMTSDLDNSFYRFNDFETNTDAQSAQSNGSRGRGIWALVFGTWCQARAALAFTSI